MDISAHLKVLQRIILHDMEVMEVTEVTEATEAMEVTEVIQVVDPEIQEIAGLVLEAEVDINNIRVWQIYFSQTYVI